MTTDQPNPIRCSHCSGTSYRKNGIVSGVQRYYCKGCGRNFTTKPKRIANELKAFAVMLYLNNMGIRKIAKVVGVSPPAVLRWIRNAHRKLPVEQRIATGSEPDIVELDEIYTYIKKTEPYARMDCLFSKAKARCCR